jgi:hypothetical protein
MKVIIVSSFLFVAFLFLSICLYPQSRAIKGSPVFHQDKNKTLEDYNVGSNTTSLRTGRLSFYNFNEATGMTVKKGNILYHDFSNGITGRTKKIGDMYFHNSSGSNISNNFENIIFQNFDDGFSGTTIQIGDFYFHDLLIQQPKKKPKFYFDYFRNSYLQFEDYNRKEE